MSTVILMRDFCHKLHQIQADFDEICIMYLLPRCSAAWGRFGGKGSVHPTGSTALKRARHQYPDRQATFDRADAPDDDLGANVGGTTIPRNGESSVFGMEHDPLKGFDAFRLVHSHVHALPFRLDQAEAAAARFQCAIEPRAEPRLHHA
jgi:hypothetical protein